jgi:hypothetical protein
MNSGGMCGNQTPHLQSEPAPSLTVVINLPAGYVTCNWLRVFEGG